MIRRLKTVPTNVVISTSVGSVIVLSFLLIALFADWIAPYDHKVLIERGPMPPSRQYKFGTDTVGRDLLSRVIYGSRISVPVAALAVSVASIIGTSIGLGSGYAGGKVDRFLSVPMDALYAFPSFVLALTIAAILGGSVGKLAIAIGMSRLPTYFRVVRSIVISLKEQQLVEAERALGAGTLYIIMHHILPRAMPSVVVLITFDIGRAILTVAALGFLGFGVPPPAAEWGTDLSLGRRVLLSGIWWPTFFPGITIFILALGVNLVGEGLNVIFNPKHTV